MAFRRLTQWGILAALLVLPLFSSPVGAQIYFSDDFEDPAKSEGQWEILTGDWQVADGVYQQLATADPWQATMVAADHWDNAWVEYTIEFDVRVLTEGDAPVNVLFRARDPLPVVWADRNGPDAHFYRWIVNGWTNTESRPYIYNAGTATMLAQTPNVLVVGQWHHIMLVVTRTRLAGYVDDVQMFDVAHAAWIEGRVGIQAYSGVMDFDDFTIYGPEYMPPWRLKAKKPEPTDGAAGVTTPLLEWTAGERAASHDVYLGTTPDLDGNNLVMPHAPVPMYWHIPGLEPGVVYYWRIDEVEADGATVHTGDVWSFVTQDLKAYYPAPADGAANVPPATVLAWAPGRDATAHRLYFGDNLDAVTQSSPEVAKGELIETAFDPCGLEVATTYWWRVDEVIAGGEIRTGPVWSFTTYLPVEDFESYNDDDNRIYDTWIDGWVNGTGSQVGYDESPFAELRIVHGGAQSMPLDYNNTESPYYSEAVREFASAQDWTINGLDTLILHVRGKSANAPTTFYVGVEDSSGYVSVAASQASLPTRTAWTEWQIPFSEFTANGVDMARIEKLYLGAGDRDNPKPGGAGLVFIDDIRVIRSGPVAEPGQ